MELNFRFAVVSDLHIGLPHTIWDHPSRFHLVEVSIPALELVLEHLHQQELDFLLLPGVQLIGLNSNQFDESGNQLGRLDEQQLVWLEQVLAQSK